MPWWKSLFRRRALDAQLDSELQFHVDELTKANIAAGMPPHEARRQAILEFGGHEQVKEELRDVHRISIMETTFANLKSAFRFIRKSPSFSTAVILTLALGIGANSAVFSAIDAILLRPLPFPDGDQLMRLENFNAKVKNWGRRLPPVRLADWNRMNSTFQAITGYYTEDNSETSGNLPEKVTAAYVAPRFLQVWGIAPALGRDFSAEEERYGGPNAILISDRFWRHRFGGDANVLGKTLRIHSFSFSIIGVMPASFAFPERDADLWVPVPVDAPYAQSRDYGWYVAIGRLRPGVTLEEARANLATVQAQLGRAYAKTDADLAVGVEPLKETTIGSVRGSLCMLYGSVSLLLLIACTNIAALLMARGAQRQHEISIRFSLGASRATIVGQLLTEAFVLALAGAALGLVVAGGASNVFRALAGHLPRVEEVRLNGRIVLYSLLCSAAATLLCGLFPAMRETSAKLAGSLAQANRTQVSVRNRMQWALVGVQVTFAVTLLAGAGLLVRSFQELGRVSPGFDPRQVLTFHITASYGETADSKGLTQRIERTITAFRNLPGVEDAATSGGLPGAPWNNQTEMHIMEGEANPERKVIAHWRAVSPSYFATMRIPLVAGELCREVPNRVNVLINRSFANTYFVASTAIGRHVLIPGNAFLPEGEIRGIVGDAREEGLEREPVPTVYWCQSAPDPDPFYLVRARIDPMAMAEPLRRQVHEIEPGRSVFDIQPLEERLTGALAEKRLRTVLLTFFAATAVALACVGLYGTLSYSVNTRQREVGLRLALGASRGQIVRHFLLAGLAVCFAGSAIGWELATAFGHVLSGMLYGVSPSDVFTMSAVALLMLLVATAACLAPSIRAARLDPMQVLREE